MAKKETVGRKKDPRRKAMKHIPWWLARVLKVGEHEVYRCAGCGRMIRMALVQRRQGTRLVNLCPYCGADELLRTQKELKRGRPTQGETEAADIEKALVVLKEKVKSAIPPAEEEEEEDVLEAAESKDSQEGEPVPARK